MRSLIIYQDVFLRKNLPAAEMPMARTATIPQPTRPDTVVPAALSLSLNA